MFINAMGLILADNNKISLGELSKPRALAAVPFGGRYRIIDYMLSSMVNSGVRSVGVITLNKYKSLMDHLGTGAAWDLDRKNEGLAILPPYVNSEANGMNESEELVGILNYLRSNKRKYVIIANSNKIMSTTFNEFLEKHESAGADASVLYNKDGIKYGNPNFVFNTDRRGFVADLLSSPEKTDYKKCSLGVVILKRELLIDIISEMISREKHSFGVQDILKKYDTLKIKALEYKGLVLRVNDVQSYFNASMRLLDETVMKELFWSGMPVYTKVKDEAPALYSESSYVINSFVSDGCRLTGEVQDSILFRGVTVSRGSKIKNCVIMQDSYISENCELENVILDKNSIIRPGVKLVGHHDFPAVIGKGGIV